MCQWSAILYEFGWGFRKISEALIRYQTILYQQFTNDVLLHLLLVTGQSPL